MDGVKRYGLRFGLLGPPVLYEPAVRPIGSPKLRALLAALLLEAGHVVSVEALKDALWDGAPPASAHASLHNHVTRLRRLLDDPERLRAVPPGYLLRVERGELDLHLFEARLAEARAAHAGADWARVVRACAEALALWRGAPLGGLPSGTGRYAVVQRLEEGRLLLLEWRYDAELALGGDRAAGLVPELTALAAEHPLREAYHRQLMLALHRTGRRAEALAVHRDLRARLADELGVEPGPAVRAAHLEVLRLDGGPDPAGDSVSPASAPGGSWPPETSEACGSSEACGASEVSDAPEPAERPDPAEPPGDSGPQPPRPAQLPPPPAHFTGRNDVLPAVWRALLTSPEPGPAPAFPPAPTPERGPRPAGDGAERSPVVVLSGMAGVGKSALALQAAHGMMERFPDGQLYVNLHGATPGMPPLTPAQALRALLRDLGADPRHIPEHPDAASALLRSLFAPTRTLLVLDDAKSAAQVRPLLPAGAGCAVIVTSRSPLTALDGVHRFPLAPLSGEDSAALLRAASGRTGFGPDGGDGSEGPDGLDAGHPLVGLTGGLPLALRVVAARLAARRALTPDALAGQLAAKGGRLRNLEYDDLSVRRSLAVAHDALAASEREADRDAALALRRIGALDLPAYSAPLLARLTGTDEHRAEAALDRLVDVALLEETAYGRYTPHDLVRDYARELADTENAENSDNSEDTENGEDSETRPDAAADPVETALRWYAAVAERLLTAVIEPGHERDDRRRPTPSQPAGHSADLLAVPPFESSEDAFAWGNRELENIVALTERYADAPATGSGRRRAAYLCLLLRLCFPHAQRGGRVAEMEVLGRTGLELARRLGDEAAEAYALGDLAGLHFLTGRHREALTLNDRSLAIWQRLDVPSRIRRGLNNRGLLLEWLGRYEESGEALRQSLDCSRQLNDPYGEAVTHSHLGNLYEHTDPRAAIEQHRLSLAIGDEIGAVIVQHTAHCNIGYAHLTLGEPDAAARHFEESLRILGGHGDWHGESQTRLGLVRALRLLGRTEAALGECAELLRRADARADRYTGGLARHQHGLLLRERGRTEEAYAQWRAALAALEGTDEQAVAAELRELLGDRPRPPHLASA
ncbi:BTAD domain-containing putative transcriptional regulator [Streptomyces naganishii]|uniref:AfsR/SARP family transcriptional regulator n=1 Tax=Streptomyces naganishii TaxID=285447 RepID=UPI0036C66101